MRKSTRTGLVVLLILSLLAGGFFFAVWREKRMVGDLREFLSTQPNFAEVQERLGAPVEEYANTDAIVETGWGKPPWKSSSRVSVFAVPRAWKVFVTMENGVVNAFWIASS